MAPDAIVIGSGFAGMSAAAALADAGARVLVLEARPGLGGRATSTKPKRSRGEGGYHARAERRKPMAESWVIVQVVSAIRARLIFGTRITSVNTS